MYLCHFLVIGRINHFCCFGSLCSHSCFCSQQKNLVPNRMVYFSNSELICFCCNCCTRILFSLSDSVDSVKFSSFSEGFVKIITQVHLVHQPIFPVSIFPFPHCSQHNVVQWEQRKELAYGLSISEDLAKHSQFLKNLLLWLTPTGDVSGMVLPTTVRHSAFQC